MMAPSAAERKMRGEGLPFCGFGVSVPISTKPNPVARSGANTRASLSKPAAMPTGLRKLRPHSCLRKPRIVRHGGAGIKSELEALDGEVMRPLRIERVEQRLAKAVQRVHGATPSGRRWVPSSCSTSASTEIT